MGLEGPFQSLPSGWERTACREGRLGARGSAARLDSQSQRKQRTRPRSRVAQPDEREGTLTPLLGYSMSIITSVIFKKENSDFQKCAPVLTSAEEAGPGPCQSSRKSCLKARGVFGGGHAAPRAC